MSLQNVQNDLLLLLLHPFNGTRKDLNGSRDDGDGSGISWTICKQSAPRSRQITTPTPHHSIFAGWMFFLMPTNSVKRVQNNLSIKILYDIDKGPATAYSILFRTSTSGIKKLQRAQNTLAWIVLPNLQSIPVASLLLRLHWLLVISHIRYKLAAITYKSLSLAQPTYLHLLLQQRQPTRSLRSGSQNLLALPTLSIFHPEIGRHAVSYCAPSVWNKLPLSIQSLNSFNSFKSHLKPICLLIINIHCPLAT